MVKRCKAQFANRGTRASAGAGPEVSGAKEDEGYQQRSGREARGDTGNQKPFLPLAERLPDPSDRRAPEDDHRFSPPGENVRVPRVGVGLASHSILHGRRQAHHPLAGARLPSSAERRAWYERDDVTRDLLGVVDEAVIAAGQHPEHHRHAEQIQTDNDAEGAWKSDRAPPW